MRSIALIDGQYLYNQMRQLGVSSINLAALIGRLGVSRGIYYTQDIPAAKEKHRKFIEAISVLPRVRVVLGHVKREVYDCPHCGHAIEKYVQKEVDVAIAVDAMWYAHGGVSKIVLVSGDTDFIPLLRALSRLPVQVVLVASSPPQSLLAEADEFLNLDALVKEVANGKALSEVQEA